MCGIVGSFGFFDESVLDDMQDAIYHRGPDESGQHLAPESDLMMGMRRLSILDLDTGSQPIYNEDGSVAVVFNGEIYNHGAIRRRLADKAHSFSTSSDTEVLVHLWEEHGEQMPEHLEGMFAFAIWDSKTEELFLARDRLGIKPLYFSNDQNRFLWASELASLLSANVDRTLDADAVYNYFTLRYWAWPQTPFESVQKLEPGTSLTVTKDGVSKRQYWSLRANPTDEGIDSFADQLRTHLERSVKRRLMSDVPLGAFLSGGLDSSSIVGIMSELQEEPVQTFAIGFQADEYDESSEAAYVADYFGSDHHEITIDLSSMDLFGDVVEQYGEPLADPAVLPNMAISRYASEEVKVVLSGEGADELFGGYWYFDEIPRHQQKFQWLPDAVFDVANAASKYTPVQRQRLQYFSALKNNDTSIRGVAQRFQIPVERYTDTGSDPESSGLNEMVASTREVAIRDDFYERMLAFDLEYWLPDDLLFKVDHASMAASLEARVPFLDHKIVEFAVDIPVEYKQTGYKPVLKRAMADVLPERTLNREKHGLGVPVSDWFRKGHEAITRWLTEENVRVTPYLQTEEVFDIWETHRHGRRDYGLTLWKILNFVAWYHTFVR